MLEQLVPVTVVTEVIEGDDPTAYLLPEEVPHIQTAVDGRKHEYTLGRSCARRALSRIGIHNVPILSGPKREPLWPDPIVGSITHCNGYCAAAVAQRTDVLALGIDAELHAPLPEGVFEHISVPAERERIAQAPPGTHWDRLLFSAKEAVYKAYFPLTQAWLGFKDAAITFNPDHTFEARLLTGSIAVGDRSVEVLTGRYAVSDRFVVVAVVLVA